MLQRWRIVKHRDLTVDDVMRMFGMSAADNLNAAVDAMNRAMPTFTQAAAAVEALVRQFQSYIDTDIASLNQTQRARYFAFRRSGLDHCDIMERL